MNPHSRRWILLGTAALIAGLAGCDGKTPGATAKPSFKGVDITGAEYARTLSLTDPDGQRRTLADFKGKVVVVFLATPNAPTSARRRWPNWPMSSVSWVPMVRGCRASS